MNENINDSERRYVSAAEVVAIAGISERMIKRLEDNGRFPKRIKLSARTTRWWFPDVSAWKKDPEAWVQNQQTANQSVA